MAFGALSRVRSTGLLSGSISPIGVDFGMGSLKVLQIAPGEPHSLVAIAEVETPPEIMLDHAKRFEFQAQALTTLVKAGGFKGKRVICGLSAAQMFCKHVQFSKSETDLAGLVQTSVAGQLGCNPGALIYRHIVVGDVAAGKVEVICLAVPSDLIFRVMELVKANRLEPVGIHPACMATLRAFQTMPGAGAGESAPADTGASLYLDIGAGTTTCLIAHDARLVFVKTIHIGGRHLDESIVRQLRCNLVWARTKRLSTERLMVTSRGTGESGCESATATLPEPGSGATSERFNLADSLETLTDEVAMCLRYHESIFPGKRVQRVVFIGGESRHRGLCRHIAMRLRLAAQVADPLARVARTGSEPCNDVDLTSPQPGYAVALGLCLSPPEL
jgi:Tfp pilus assembly PilM family ATPase